ncbi:UNVERIFIED_ORG: hypothetical protein J2W38_003018 [Variovorax paradoxus]|jgi:hypothetical protein|nr:hypothetical protein [Variovorax paradoxus]
MNDRTTVEATTNETQNSCVDVHCDCPTLWSMSQQFCYLRLSNSTEKKEGGGESYRLINYFPARARRIAATYARLYLELEEHSTPAKKGRYYWMALGAFASKTVACSIESLQLTWTRGVMGSTVREGLGQGNFWLFNDIAAWHWFYNVSPDSFEHCLEERNTSTYVAKVKEQVDKLPWSAQSLAKIDNLKVKPEVRQGFELVKKIETSSPSPRREENQLRHLMVMAAHEQKNILQKLIYDNADFSWWIKVQRNDAELRGLTKAFAVPASWVSPKLKVSFVNQCDTDLPEYSNVASQDTKLEDYQSRMKWIGLVGNQFHDLMRRKASSMDAELSTMAGWVDTSDSVVYLDESRAR